MLTKICTHCPEQGAQPVSNFGFKNSITGLRQPWCRSCSNKYRKQWYIKNRQKQINNVVARNRAIRHTILTWIFEFLDKHPCIDCGGTDILVLDFDHRADKIKSGHVITMALKGCKLETIKNEVAKCDVRCSNCHRRKTAKEQNTFRYRYVTNKMVAD